MGQNRSTRPAKWQCACSQLYAPAPPQQRTYRMVLLHIVLTFCTAAILAPFSYYAGQGARYLRLPQITGYLLSGIVCGPFLLGILSKESVTELNIIEGACLSIIGLAAGAELDLPALQRARKQVRDSTAASPQLSAPGAHLCKQRQCTPTRRASASAQGRPSVRAAGSRRTADHTLASAPSQGPSSL